MKNWEREWTACVIGCCRADLCEVAVLWGNGGNVPAFGILLALEHVKTVEVMMDMCEKEAMNLERKEILVSLWRLKSSGLPENIRDKAGKDLSAAF